MTDTEQRMAAKAFAEHWKGRGYEKGESQSFWIELLQTVYGIENATQFIVFEEQVHLDHTSFIDGMIPSTKVMIEQKGIGKDLNKPIKQSDGSLLTPFQQAKRYITELPLSQHPRWVVTCNFEIFQVYDMERPGGEPEIILLENLEKEYYRLQFLVDKGSEHLKREMEVSIAAGEIVGLLYDAFAKQYDDPMDDRTLHSLNVLCVRFVFCLWAEDSGAFGHHGMFHDPACGSGNFLTESYLSLRRLENDVLRELYHGQITFGDENYNPIQVSLKQFYGIEINDFAVTVAKTALWIAESQMMKETESIVLMHLDFLPLKSYTNIVEGNALRLNWEDVVPKHNLAVIMGNPPFVGYSLQSKE